MGNNRMEIDTVKVCDVCGSTSFYTDYVKGERICSKCGVVVEEILDDGPRPVYEGKEDRIQNGPPVKNNDPSSKGSVISNNGRDGNGKKLNPVQTRRLREWERRTRFNKALERSQDAAKTRIEKMCSALSIPGTIADDSLFLYRKAAKKCLIRGRSIDTVCAALIYMSCRRINRPRTLEEIANGSGLGRREIGRTYRIMSRSLGIKLNPTNPGDYLNGFCSRLDLAPDTKRKAQELLQSARSMELDSGKGPTGIAAAAIYIASIQNNDRRTQSEIASVCGVTEVTIRNRYKEMANVLGILVEV